MRTNHKLTLALLVGVGVGVTGATAIRGQQVKVPPAYIIAEVEVTDQATMQKYAEQVPATLAPFNGRYVVLGGKSQSLEGEPPKFIAILGFDSVEKANDWWNSPAYEALKPLRHEAAKSRLYMVEGH